MSQQALQGESDGSESLFSMYLDRTITKDKEMVESWKGDADKILVFTGVFSATVAALLAVSVPNIVQNPQDTSAFYLAHIYQQLSTQPNGSHPSIPSSLSNPIKPFTPPSSSVWVNGLWFLSLVISLTCALLATLAQQWARHYLKNAYRRYSPHKRARLRAFHRHGVEKLHIPWTMEAVPVLLHLSLFLFLAGLSVFLFSVHHTIFKVVTAWIALCVILYAFLTILPYMYKNSPYSTPLSALVFSGLTGIRYFFFRLLQRFPQIDPSICMPLRDPWTVHLDDFFSYSMRKTAEQIAFKLKPDIDHRSLMWTFESLDEDTDLEKFFEGLPRLCDSDIGTELDLQDFIKQNKKKLSSSLTGLMNRTLSSNLVSESVKQRRMIICTKAVESTSLLGPWYILPRVLFGDWYRFLGCIEFGLLMQNWKNIPDKATSFAAQCVAALTISIVQRDERWIQLASGLLNVSKPLLHKYVANGDSILLANLIFIIRRTVQAYSGSAAHNKDVILNASSRTLEALCKLNIQGTLPELQYEFCDLWNLLVQTAKTDQRPHHAFVSLATLKNIRKLFITFHHESARTLPTAFYTTTDDRDPVLDNSESYPTCMIFEHRPFLPVPGLQFDEPPPDATGDAAPTPDIMPMPIPTFQYPPVQPSTFTMPYYSSSPPAMYPTLPVPSLYGVPIAIPQSQSAAPSDAKVPFREPQLTRSHTSNVLPAGDAQSPPLPPLPTPSPPGSASSALSIHRTMYPQTPDPWGGHI